MSQQPQQPGARSDEGEREDRENRVVVVTQDGMGVATPGGDEESAGTNPADLVEQPAKVMRIGSMIKNLLDEVKGAPLDDAGRARLADIHGRSIQELKSGLAPELVEELDRLALPFKEETPSDAELRIAQAQLVGWLEGLFHGIQTALFAQQMAAQQQLQGMRRALPPGASMPGQPQPGGAEGHPRRADGPVPLATPGRVRPSWPAPARSARTTCPTARTAQPSGSGSRAAASRTTYPALRGFSSDSNSSTLPVEPAHAEQPHRQSVADEQRRPRRIRARPARGRGTRGSR